MLARAIAKHLAGTVTGDTHTPGAIDGLRYQETAGGNVFLHEMPAQPDTAILIKVSGGDPVPGRNAHALPAIQIIVRGDIFDDAETIAAAIHTELDLLDRVTLDDGGDDEVYVHGFTARQSHPIDIGMDDNRRPERSINLDATISHPTSNRTAA